MKAFGLRQPGIDLAIDVGPGLHVVGGRGPVEADLAVLQHAALRHRVIAHPVAESVPAGSFQSFSAQLPMLRIEDHHVGGQAMGEGADLARRAAGRGLAGQREGAVARLGDLAHQQVHVVDHVVDPGAARVLVEAHGPVGGDLGLRI
jgi:hypothetical protein